MCIFITLSTQQQKNVLGKPTSTKVGKLNNQIRNGTQKKKTYNNNKKERENTFCRQFIHFVFCSNPSNSMVSGVYDSII